MNIKTAFKASVAIAALFAAAPADAGDWAGANDNGVTMSGSVVRSLLRIDDGESRQLFHVDGASDNSRLRWAIKGRMSEDLEVGGLVEMNIPTSNPAGRANFRGGVSTNRTIQGSEREESYDTPAGSGDAAWGIRHAVIDLKHEAMGTLSIGQSSTAADGAFEQHLGGFAHVGVGACDYGCATRFIVRGDTFQPIPPDRHTLIEDAPHVRLEDVVTSYDAGRDDRVRYDTPSFGGFKAAASLIDGGQWDAALTYGGKFGGVQVAAAAYRHLAAESATVDAVYGGSLAVKHDSGLNASVGYFIALQRDL